jgi:RNA 3'-terminal phosphate cyclase (ATP)
VAERAIADVRRYVSAGVPVGKHLADQLLVPLALARGGSFRTMALTRHTTTNIDIIERFLDLRIRQERRAKDDVVVEVGVA